MKLPKDNTPITSAQAIAAVAKFSAVKFFSNVTPEGQAAIAERFLALINTPDGKPLMGANGKPIRYGPTERLKFLVDVVLRMVDGWPGIGEIEAIYGTQMFPPGDGIERPPPSVPGYREDDVVDGVAVQLLPRAPEPTYLPGPDDEPIGEEFLAQLEEVAQKKRIPAGRATEAIRKETTL